MGGKKALHPYSINKKPFVLHKGHNMSKMKNSIIFGLKYEFIWLIAGSIINLIRMS